MFEKMKKMNNCSGSRRRDDRRSKVLERLMQGSDDARLNILALYICMCVFNANACVLAV